MESLPVHLLSLAWDQVRLGLILLDQSFHIRGWNRFLADRSVMFTEQLHGRPFLEAFPEADTPCWHGMTKRVAESGTQVFVQWDENPYLIALPAPEGKGSLMLQSTLLVPFVDSQEDRFYALFIMDTTGVVKHNMGLEKALEGLSSKQQEFAPLKKALETANSQLLQSEKLASIGQLAAGVAHEINNPVGYVSSNLKTLTGYVENLLKIIDAMEPEQSKGALHQLKVDLEYDYIKCDIRSLMAESEDGIDRVMRIVSALKDFSYISEESFVAADLQQGIETTLNVVNNEIKYKAEVVCEFEELPNVECIASQINQVVMNLLLNASHAIDGFGRISLRSGSDSEGDQVWFEVEDNGSGIDAVTMPRIFDPFFTTKPVGTGTGLGLALSYNIIKKHHGRIDVDSQPGRGTRFRVWLPARQPRAEVADEQ
jgi:two-component system NtrC family sensor kinase